MFFRWVTDFSNPLLEPAASTAISWLIEKGARVSQNSIEKSFVEIRVEIEGVSNWEIEGVGNVFDLIEISQIESLFCTYPAELTLRQFESLKAVLKACVEKFFTCFVDSFQIFSVQGVVKFVPLLSNGYGIYRTWSERSYFLYWLDMSQLLNKVVLSTSPLTQAALAICDECPERQIFDLFGVWMIEGSKEGNPSLPFDQEFPFELSLAIDSLTDRGIYTLALPHQEILAEIGQQFSILASGTNLPPDELLFSIRTFRVGPFWLQLDKNWLKSAWKEVCLGRLPKVTLSYLEEESDLSKEQLSAQLYMLSYLALLKVSPQHLGDIISGQNFTTFPVESLTSLRKIFSEVKKNFSQIDRWTLLAASDLEQMRVLQLAIEEKFPYSYALGLESLLVVANTLSASPFEFSEQEVQQSQQAYAEGVVSKQYLPILVSPIEIPLLQQKEGRAYVEMGGQKFFLGISYAELITNWSEALLSPWAVARLKEGQWTELWWRT